jgi:hypothetical protein
MATKGRMVHEPSGSGAFVSHPHVAARRDGAIARFRLSPSPRGGAAIGSLCLERPASTFSSRRTGPYGLSPASPLPSSCKGQETNELFAGGPSAWACARRAADVLDVSRYQRDGCDFVSARRGADGSHAADASIASSCAALRPAAKGWVAQGNRIKFRDNIGSWCHAMARIQPSAVSFQLRSLEGEK